MNKTTEAQPQMPSWLKTTIWIAVCGAIGYFIAQRAAERRAEPQVRAAEQLVRDLDSIQTMPAHRRLAELFEALQRANDASPELADVLIASESENSQFLGYLLQMVKDQPHLANAEFREQLSETLKRDPDFFRRSWSRSLQ